MFCKEDSFCYKRIYLLNKKRRKREKEGRKEVGRKEGKKNGEGETNDNLRSKMRK